MNETLLQPVLHSLNRDSKNGIVMPFESVVLGGWKHERASGKKYHVWDGVAIESMGKCMELIIIF
jgi:hypothetical protein